MILKRQEKKLKIAHIAIFLLRFIMTFFLEKLVLKPAIALDPRVLKSDPHLPKIIVLFASLKVLYK